MILGKICEKIVDCEHKTAPTLPTGIPSIRTPNIGHGRLLLDGVNRVSEETWKEWTKREIPKENDLILAREAPLGNVAIVPNNLKLCLGQRTVLLRPDSSKVVPKFLCYLLLGPEMQHAMYSRGGGATVPHLNVGDIRKLPIEQLPTPATQRKIASILSAYDDLIENNLRRIKLLVELAQITFNEWFANVEGLPVEWEEVYLGSFVEHEIGGGWGEEVQSTEFCMPANVIRGTDIDELPKGKLENVPFRYHKKSNLASRELQDGDIVFEVSGGSSFEGVAKTLLITDELLEQFNNDVMCASFCKLLRPENREHSYFLFHLMRFLRQVKGTEVFEIRSASNIVNYNWTAFLKFQKVKKPTNELIEKFNQVVVPIHKQIYNLGHQNRLLKEARDILLPRLMTGLIDVAKIELNEAVTA